MDYSGILIKETDKARLVSIDGKEHWIPISGFTRASKNVRNHPKGEGAEISFSLEGWATKLIETP